MAGVKSSSGSEIYGMVGNTGTGSQGQVARFAAHLSGPRFDRARPFGDEIRFIQSPTCDAIGDLFVKLQFTLR